MALAVSGRDTRRGHLALEGFAVAIKAGRSLRMTPFPCVALGGENRDQAR
jgi:hypothetical protein